MPYKHENPAGDNGRASGGMDPSQCEEPTLLPLPEPVNPALKRRNILEATARKTPKRRASDRCYNVNGDLIRALRKRRELSERRLRELGVSSLADFVWRQRRPFRRLMGIYRVKRFRDLLPFYGKETGCWQFDHLKPLSEIDPDDDAQLLIYCHVSNIEPVTWWENAQRRDAAKRKPFTDDLGLFAEGRESWK